MLVFPYLISFSVLVGVSLYLSRRKGVLYFPVYFYLYLATFHTLVPLFLMVGSNAFFPILPRQFLLPLLTDAHYVLALVLVWTAAIAFPVGWVVGGRIPLLVLQGPTQSSQDIPEGRAAITVSWIILVLGAIGFFAYFHAFGGIFQALAVAREFRTGLFEVNNPFSFMRPIGDFTKVAALVFLSLWVAGRRNVSVLAGLGLSLTFALLMILFQGGRLTLALHLFLVAIILVSSGYLSLIRAAVIGAASFLVLLYGYQILFFLYSLFTAAEGSTPGSIDTLSPLEFFVSELSFASIGLATAVDAIEAGVASLRYGVDVVYGILSILPSRFVDFDFETATAFHTDISNPSGGGTIPVDMITYGVYSAYAFGPAIVSLIVGATVKVVFRYVRRIPWPHIRLALALYFLFMFARHLVYFDPASSINSIYFLILCFVLVYTVSRSTARRPCESGPGVRGTRADGQNATGRSLVRGM